MGAYGDLAGDDRYLPSARQGEATACWPGSMAAGDRYLPAVSSRREGS